MRPKLSVPSPLSLKVTPDGSAPVWLSAAIGKPLVVTTKLPDWPAVKLVEAALVMAGPAVTVTVSGGHLDDTLTIVLVFLSLAWAVVGFALLTPSAQALISRRTDQSHQGEILGVNQSASALARILGPLFGLTLYKMTDTHLLPYLFGGVLLLLMLPLMPRIRRGA